MLRLLACPRPHRDAFATKANAQFPLFWAEEDDAFQQEWGGPHPLWMNPPFSMLDRLASKLWAEGGHAVVFCPAWSEALAPLRGMCLREHPVPAVPMFVRLGTQLMPAPRWQVWIFYIRRPPPRPPVLLSAPEVIEPPKPAPKADAFTRSSDPRTR